MSQANYHIEIGFPQGDGDGSCFTGGMDRQIGICDQVSIPNAIRVPIVLRVSIYMISVTKSWDMLIRLSMCKGRIGHAGVLDFTCRWLTTNERDIIMTVTIQCDNEN